MGTYLVFRSFCVKIEKKTVVFFLCFKIITYFCTY